jgi:hypothetical protein
MDNFKRALRDARRSVKKRGIPGVVGAALVYFGFWAAAHWFPSVRANVTPALQALAITAALGVLYLLGIFAHHWHLAAARAQIELLETRPADDRAAQSEAERLRTLRQWVGLIQGDVRDKRARIERIREDGCFWDPEHSHYKLDLGRFSQAGGLLAGDPTTEPAHRACDELRREMRRVNDIVRRRYGEAFHETGLSIPYLFSYAPEVRDEDTALIDRLLSACDTVDNALTGAMEALTP